MSRPAHSAAASRARRIRSSRPVVRTIAMFLEKAFVCPCVPRSTLPTFPVQCKKKPQLNGARRKKKREGPCPTASYHNPWDMSHCAKALLPPPPPSLSLTPVRLGCLFPSSSLRQRNSGVSCVHQQCFKIRLRDAFQPHTGLFFSVKNATAPCCSAGLLGFRAAHHARRRGKRRCACACAWQCHGGRSTT